MEIDVMEEPPSYTSLVCIYMCYKDNYNKNGWEKG